MAKSVARSLGFSIGIFLLGAAGITYLKINPCGASKFYAFLSKLFLAGGLGWTALILLAWLLLGGEHAGRFLINSYLMAGSVLLTLFFGEFLVRAAYHNITTTSDNSSYFARKWFKENVKLNSFGFREREISADRDRSVYRLAIVGDSFTFGQGIAVSERYSNLLEEELNSDGRSIRYEVLNFGKPGAETIDDIQILDTLVLRLRPDFVLVQWYVNDVEGHDKTEGPRTWRLIPSDVLSSFLHKNSALFYIAEQQWQSLQTKLFSEEDPLSYMIKRFYDEKSPSMQAAEDAVGRLIEICKNARVPVGFVLFPKIYPGWQKHYALGFLHERIARICEQEGVPYLDLREAYAKYENCRLLFVNRFDQHPSALANRIAAKEMLTFYREFWSAEKNFKPGFQTDSTGTD